MAGNYIQLPYTLQTTVGMVLNGGLPATRHHPEFAPGKFKPGNEGEPNSMKLELKVELPRMSRSKQERTIASFQDFVKHPWTSPKYKPLAQAAIECMRQKRPLSPACVVGTVSDTFRYIGNIAACSSPEVDVHRLMTLIKTRTRLDLEQAAAVVVAAFVSESRLNDAAFLLGELTGVLAVSDMSVPSWTDLTTRNTITQGSKAAFANFAKTVHFWCLRALNASQVNIDSHPPRNYTDLVQLLLRVQPARASRSTRCLSIPQWMFEEAGISDPPPPHGESTVSYIYGTSPLSKPHSPDTILVSMHGFRIIQKRIFRLFPYWDTQVLLRRDIHSLEEKVLYATDWIDNKLRTTDDVAEIAYWFFAYQRRLQLKVVSDDKWTTFLAKGESSTVYQNNTGLKSTFERALQKIAGLNDSDTMGSKEDTLVLIDRTCELMKRYVDEYGKGEKGNLTFDRSRSGGSGRGPVDEYNLLCDVLRELKQRAKNEGTEKLPGPVYKFLAKDIMAWNDGWADDAFANGRVHGWEDWLKDPETVERQLARRMRSVNAGG